MRSLAGGPAQAEAVRTLSSGLAEPFPQGLACRRLIKSPRRPPCKG